MAKVTNLSNRDLTRGAWWERTRIAVEWTASRDYDLPILGAEGRISMRPEDGPDTSVGTIRVFKPYLWVGVEPFYSMDSLSADLSKLATTAPLFDGQQYSEEFCEWFEQTHGLLASGDPLFIEDLQLQVDPAARERFAGLAVVEAAMAFGSCDSPIIGPGHDFVEPEQREKWRTLGLWDWVAPVGAVAWKGLVIGSRPQSG